ncbi:MAG: hypothetical protein Q4B17_02140 [Lautropia sp.]|nr:hypothetical protein [Lautropia sp.]
MMNDLLASRILGRIRLRGERLRSPAGLDGLQRRLQVQPGVVSVRSNARVGSLLIQYDPVRLPQPEVLGRLQVLLDQHLPVCRADVPDVSGMPGTSGGTPVLVEGAGQRAARAPMQTGGEAPGQQAEQSVKTGAPDEGPWKGWWALQAEQRGEATPSPRGSERVHKRNWRKIANQVAKQGMLLSLGSSLGLVAAGSKKGHAVTGSAFVGLLGVHLAIHRKSLFR